jgi:hypothetical protein
MGDARVVGMTGVRAWSGEVDRVFREDLLRSVAQETPDSVPRTTDGTRLYAALLLSGGGDDGAFGAGFLGGWTETGTRPPFKIVTGISVGALIAPYAFLGQDYDRKLEEVFTSIESKDVFRKKKPPRESLARSEPLAELIARHFDNDLLIEIARAHGQGRRLYVGTANLDYQRMAVWNMGRIAEIGGPEALSLFHDVLLASASIPVALPPVYIEVEVGGARYDEMHVDGGTMAQFFFMAATVDLLRLAEGSDLIDYPIDGRAYVIRNGRILAEPEQIKRGLLSIAGRSLSTVIKAQAGGDLARVWAFAEDQDIKLWYVGIPEDFAAGKRGPFDPEATRRLYDLGLELGRSPDSWSDEPPVQD